MATRKQSPAAQSKRKPATMGDDVQAPLKESTDAKNDPQEEPWNICTDFFEPITSLLDDLYVWETVPFAEDEHGEIVYSDVVCFHSDARSVQSRLWEVLGEAAFASVWFEVNISVELADRVRNSIQELSALLTQQRYGSDVQTDIYNAINHQRLYLKNLSIALRSQNIQKSQIPRDDRKTPAMTRTEIAKIFKLDKKKVPEKLAKHPHWFEGTGRKSKIVMLHKDMPPGYQDFLRS